MRSINFALFEPTFRGAAIVRSDDIRIDPRYGQNAPRDGVPAGHLPVVSYLAVPVVSRSGDVLGGLFLGHDQPGMFTAESEELVQGIAAHAAIAIDNARLHQAAQSEIERRRRAEDAKDLMLSEIKHRVKNTLGTVQAIAAQTFRQAPSEERDSFVARLRALADAHDLLTDRNWDGAVVGDVVQRALAPFQERHRERFQVSGPHAWLNASKSLLLAMALHELATNAVKYGALSNGSGVVNVAWELSGDTGSNSIKLGWRESGGPRVEPPQHKGFGSLLIKRALVGEEGTASLDFAPEGVVCALNMKL
jgi:two-component sensor histidine kinase